MLGVAPELQEPREGAQERWGTWGIVSGAAVPPDRGVPVSVFEGAARGRSWCGRIPLQVTFGGKRYTL